MGRIREGDDVVEEEEITEGEDKRGRDGDGFDVIVSMNAKPLVWHGIRSQLRECHAMQCKARQDKARQGKAGREDVTAERLPSSAVQCMHAEGFTSSMTNFNPNFLLMISLYAVQNACAYPFETISCTCSAVQIDWKITRMIRYAVITHMICTQ